MIIKKKLNFIILRLLDAQRGQFYNEKNTNINPFKNGRN